MKKIICILGALCLFIGNSDARPRKRHVRRNNITRSIKPKKVIQEKSSNQFITAKQATLIDVETGKVLYELSANERCTPSSMTKLMTLYILFSEIKKGNIKLQDEFQVSELAQQQEGSRSFFKAGTMAKVEDLVRSIIVHSGNDACVVVAEGLFGDVSAFVHEMNEFAQAFGLEDTHFMNPMGLPDDEHYSTANDLAKIARRLILDFPGYYHYFSEKEFTVNGIKQPNRNTLLGNSLNVDGLKTGHTNAGGYGIVVSAEQGGRRLISVVNGCKGTKLRAIDANKLLAMGFREFVKCKVTEAGKPITSAKIWLGKQDVIEVCSNESITISIPRKFRNSLKIQAKINEPIEAPVKMGDQVGYLTYTYDGYESKRYPLFALESVEKLNWWERAIFTVKRLVLGETDSELIKKEKSDKAMPKSPDLRQLNIGGNK